MNNDQQFCACGRVKPSCDESRAGCFDGQPMSEYLAYKWAHQCLRDDMGLQQHHAEQLLDRIASAVVESAKRERVLIEKGGES